MSLFPVTKKKQPLQKVNSITSESESEPDRYRGTSSTSTQLTPQSSQTQTQRHNHNNVNGTVNDNESRPKRRNSAETQSQPDPEQLKSSTRKKRPPKEPLSKMEKQRRDKIKKNETMAKNAGMKIGALDKYLVKVESTPSSANTVTSEVRVGGASERPTPNVPIPIVVCIESTPPRHPSQKPDVKPQLQPPPATPSTSKNPPLILMASPIPKTETEIIPSAPDKPATCPYEQSPKTPPSAPLDVSSKPKPKPTFDLDPLMVCKLYKAKRRLVFEDEREEEVNVKDEEPEPGPLYVTPPENPVPGPSNVNLQIHELETQPLDSRRTLKRSLTAESKSSDDGDGEIEPKCKSSLRGNKRKVYSWEQSEETEPPAKKGKSSSDQQSDFVNCIDPMIHKDIIYHAVLEHEKKIKVKLRKQGISQICSSLMAAHPINNTFEILDGLCEAFQMIAEATIPPSNCYFEVLTRILDKAENDKAEQQLKLVYKYLDGLFAYVDQNLESYELSTVKLHLSMIAYLFQGPKEYRESWVQNIKSNFKVLIEYFLRNAQNDTGPLSQFALVRNFLNSALNHYLKYDNPTCIRTYITRNELIKLFVDTVGDNHSAGLLFIREIKNTKLGLKICEELIVRQFSELSGRPEADIHSCLIDLLQKKSLFNNAEAEANPPAVEPEVEQKFKRTKHKYGNSELHKLCSKLKKTDNPYEVNENLEIQLVAEMASGGNVNVVDNFENTPLHDAASDGRLDAVQLLIDKCWKVENIGTPNNLDLLAQNNAGDAPLHISISQLIDFAFTKPNDLDSIQMRLDVISQLTKPLVEQAPQEFLKLIQLKNNTGQTPFSQALTLPPDSNIRNDILNILDDCFPDSLNNERKYGEVVFKPRSLDRLCWDTELQALINCWEFFYNECKV